MSVNEPTLGLKPQIDKESVTKTLNKMKKGKASATSGVVQQMLLASDDLGIEWMTNLFNQIIAQSTKYRKTGTNAIVTCFKKKGEVTERGNYRGFHALKIPWKEVGALFAFVDL